MAMCLAITLAFTAPAQEEQPTDTIPPVTVADVEASIQATQDDQTMDQAVKAQVLDLYNQTLTRVKARDEWVATADNFKKSREDAPAELNDIQQKLLEPLTTPDLAAEFAPDLGEAEAERTFEEATAAELESRLTEAESQLAQARSDLADLEKEPGRRADRRKLIPDWQAEARKRLEEALAARGALANSTESENIVKAKSMLLAARIQAAEQELRAYTEELQSYESRGRLLTAKQDQATRRVAKAERLTNAWRQAVSERRNEEAMRAAIESQAALLEAENAPRSIREEISALAAKNVKIATARTGNDGVLRQIEQVDRRLQEVEGTLTTLDSDFTSVQNRVDAAGNSGAIGVLLRNKRTGLPKIADLRRNIRLRSQTISKVQLDQLEYEDDRRALADVESVVESQLDALASGAADEQRERLANLLRETYRIQRNGLDELLRDIQTYFEKLIDLDAKEKQLIEQAREFENYIDEHILWIQSGSVFAVRDLRNAVAALLWLALPENLVQVPSAILQDFLAAPVPLALVYAFPIALIFAGRVIRKRILDLGEKASKRRCVDIRLTLSATLLVLLQSIGFPLLFGVLGWRLSSSLYSGEFARAVGQAFMTSGVALWSLLLPRMVLRPGSLGVAHFGWPKEPLKRLSRSLTRFLPVAVILVYWIAIFEADGNLDRQESAGRLSFVLLIIAVAVLSYVLLKPRGGALLDTFDIWRGRGRLGVRRFWFAMSMATPILLIIAAGSGYYYSALRLSSRLYITTFVAFLLLLVAAIALRWSLLARRRTAIAQAKRRLEALKAKQAEGETPPEEPELDLAKVDSQTGRLVRSSFLIALLVSMWFIWAEFLPALSVLNEVEVWQTAGETTTQVQLPNGEFEAQTTPIQIPITWRDVVVALLIGIATFIAVQNVPGLFEFAVLQRLPLVAGERYAVKTIFGYGLVLIGFLWAVTTIGLGWSQVQWLVAAVGLGLGFGLQEIFANFIAGLIILFEQPIRVGDTVTVGDTSGKVSKIRIRATWITAFNRQELIVPNKEFVTSRLINWTLSDQVLRIEVHVGIAYGADTKKARRILHEVANANELVLHDPAPEVYFFGFGDNALQFELRVYSPNMESFLRIKDEMHQQVDDAFRKAGIEIAFPQRDIHIRHIKDVLPIKQVDQDQES